MHGSVFWITSLLHDYEIRALSKVIKYFSIYLLFSKLCNVIINGRSMRGLNKVRTIYTYTANISVSSFQSIVGSFACNCFFFFVYSVMIIGFTTNDNNCLGKNLYYLFSSLIVCILMLSRFGQPTPINRKELQLLFLCCPLFCLM